MRKLLSLTLLLPCWALFALSGLIKRDRSLVAFGVHTNTISGNVKSLFCSGECEYLKVFVSSNSSLIEELQRDGHLAYTKNSFKGILYALRAGTYIYSGFPSDINFWLSRGAKYVNVWHGTPIKKIERDVATGYYSLRNRFPWLYRLGAPYFLARPDALLVSSPYEEQCFKSAFDIGEDSLVRAFPPRLIDLTNRENKGVTRILYAPTWRDDQSFRIADHIDWQSFNTFLATHKLHFHIKLHPSDTTNSPDGGFTHIATIDKNEDIYCHLMETDILVSDYSSMIFEGLYLAMPVILFCPDYIAYQRSSRELYADPCSISQSTISYSQTELEKNILRLLASENIASSYSNRLSPYPVQSNLLSTLIDKAFA
jgi:CDP-glycerol glycerophosphotransferase (TagB/SpsB family)